MISGFTRIDTVTIPDRFVSFVHVSDEGDADIEYIRTTLEKDKDSLDYLGIRSDVDPLLVPDLYKDIKAVKPRGLKVLMVTEGSDPNALDDLIGARYVKAVDLLLGKEIDEDQIGCIRIIEDNGCKFAVTVNAWEHDGDSIADLSKHCKGCSMFILKTDRKHDVDKKKISALTSAAKKITWNVRTA